MPIPRSPAYRLDLWTAPRPAGGTRVAFLVEPGGGRAAFNVQCTESIEPGQSRLTFDVLPDFHAVASLAPQSGVVALTRFTPTGPDTYTESTREWRIVSRARTVRKGLGAYHIACVPLEEDLQDADLLRETSSAGLATWRYGATDRLPADVLGDIVTRLAAVGITWVEVGTVDSTTPVTFELIGVATPYAIAQALVEALAALGETVEYQCALAADLSAYQLHLVTRIAGDLDPLLATTDANATDLTYHEDALEQANVIIPFTPDGIDLRELQVEVAAVDPVMGWVELEPIGGGGTVIVAVDEQFNGVWLYRESTGLSYEIFDTIPGLGAVELDPLEMPGDLAVGERVSFRTAAGARLVEVTDPVAIRDSRRKVARLDVDCTGATNRVVNGDLSAWAGASTDPPDGWTVEDVVGSVTRTRVTDALLTRYGGRAWQLAFAAGASASIYSPVIPIHPIAGAEQVAAAMALLFVAFTGNVPVTMTLYKVASGTGVRTALADTASIAVYPPDSTASVEGAFKAALDTWYDAALTNQSLAEWSAGDSLQLGLTRAAGASNPACTLVLDAAMLVQREGLPAAVDGGVRYVFGSDALPMLAAANAALLDRANPLVRLEGRVLDVFRIDAARYRPFELVPGRDVTLAIPPLDLTRTVRLLTRSGNEDDPGSAQVVLDRLRPNVGRLLARTLTLPAPADPVTATPGALVYAHCQASVVFSATQATITVTGTAPAGTPTVKLVALSGAATLDSGAAIGTPVASGSVWVFNRPAVDAADSQVAFQCDVPGGVSDLDLQVIPAIGRDTVPLVMRARVLPSTAPNIVVRVAVADPYPDAAPNSVSISYLSEGTGGVTPASPQTVTPAATLTEAAGTYVDFTITQPAFGEPSGRVTFTATRAGRLSDSDAVDVPAQGPEPAWLNVRPQKPTTTQRVIYWDGFPSVLLSIDGGAPATPPASPITVSRNAAGGATKYYTFSTGVDDLGGSRSETVEIPPQVASPPSDPRITSAYVSAAETPGDGGGSVTITFAFENMPVGRTFDIEVVPTQGDDITDFGGETDTGVTSSPHTVSIALGADAQVDVTITAKSSGGTVLDTYFFHSGALPA